jgi:sulfur carrier protein
VEVELKLFATFRQGRFKQKHLTLAEGTLLSEVVEPLALGDRPKKIVMVNGISIIETDDPVLSDKDVIAIFPMIAGG